MADYKWPDAEKRTLIGKRISRLDGPAKASGKAKYCYDYNRQGLLYGKILRSPHAHAKIKSIDTSAAEKMPGVKAVKVIQGPGTEIFWAGDEIVGIAAVDEPTAEDAMRAIKIEYEVLPHHVIDNDPKSTPQDLLKPSGDQTTGEPDKAFGDADVVVEGQYGQPVITHCCLESHGATSEWTDDKNLLVHVSTQNVSGIANQMAGVVKVPAANIHVQQDHIGGGFGSKFSIDRWGNESALLSKMADGKPVNIPRAQLRTDGRGRSPLVVCESQDRSKERRRVDCLGI